MSTKKTEMKVSINCKKCKTGVLKIVTKITGMDEVKLDAEKGILTVVGSADPVCIATKLRKAGYSAQITSVGPPKKPDPDNKQKQKSPNQKPKSPKEPLPQCCKQCQLMGVAYVTYDTPAALCSIL